MRGGEKARTRQGSLVAGAMLVSTLICPVASAEPVYDWWLIEFHTGNEWANFEYSIDYTAHADSPSGPVAWGNGWGYLSPTYSWPGGGVSVTEWGNDGASISTTKDYGSQYAQITPGTPILDADISVHVGHDMRSVNGNSTIYVLQFWANGSLQPAPISLTVRKGEVSVTETFGTGSRAVKVADPENDGAAAGLPTGDVVGNTIAHASPETGIAGGFYFCDDCSGTWTTPDGSSGQWRSKRSPWNGFQGSFNENAWYAGPAGDWSWTWKGHDGGTLDGSKILTAYAPVGDAWPAFACAVPEYPQVYCTIH